MANRYPNVQFKIPTWHSLKLSWNVWICCELNLSIVTITFSTFICKFENDKTKKFLSSTKHMLVSKRLLPIVQDPRAFLDKGSHYHSFSSSLSPRVQPSLNKKKFQSLEEFLTKKSHFQLDLWHLRESQTNQTLNLRVWRRMKKKSGLFSHELNK